MLAQSADDFLPAALLNLMAELIECVVNNVVMMKYFRREFAAEFKPDAVQQVDFLGGKLWRVWTEIKNIELPAWRIDFQRKRDFRFRQRFPCQACNARLVRHGSP